jgi:hypothetical protein
MMFDMKQDVGRAIFCTFTNDDGIASKTWFSAPPDSISHVGLEYLQGRFFNVQSEREMDYIKESYKAVYEALRLGDLDGDTQSIMPLNPTGERIAILAEALTKIKDAYAGEYGGHIDAYEMRAIAREALEKVRVVKKPEIICQLCGKKQESKNELKRHKWFDHPELRRGRMNTNDTK